MPDSKGYGRIIFGYHPTMREAELSVGLKQVGTMAEAACTLERIVQEHLMRVNYRLQRLQDI